MVDGNKIILGFCGLTAMTLLSGCVVSGYGGATVVAPPATATVVVYPDYYFWDGYEYVGIVGGRYYYLGPRHVWIACEPFRVARVVRWERDHPDWHDHLTRNERYRPAEHGHDRDHGRDHGWNPHDHND